MFWGIKQHKSHDQMRAIRFMENEIRYTFQEYKFILSQKKKKKTQSLTKSS